MASIPSNLTRVPTYLASQISFDALTRTNTELLTLQAQLTSGLSLLRTSDDPIAGSLVSVLDSDLESAFQRERNFTHATSVLNTIDAELSSINELVLQAKEIASSQVGVGSDTTTRAQQASIVDSLIDELVLAINSDFGGLSLFGGSRTGVSPIEFTQGGYRYNGDRSGLFTDLGPGLNFPITLSADEAIGSLSQRVEGSVDLDAQLRADTRIVDLRGPAQDITGLGSVSVTLTNGPATTITVDLSEAETMGDVVDILESEIRTNGPAGALAGAFPGGITLAGDRLQINAGAGWDIAFDATTATPGSTARALGLDSFTFNAGNPSNPAPNADLDPRVTEDTPLSALNPTPALAFGDIVFNNGGRSGTVTTNGAMTVGELQQAVARLDLGMRVEISSDGESIDIVNELSGTRASIEEGGGTAASTLGIRSLDFSTSLAVFNDGRGVEIADGTGDPDFDNDFSITLSDGTSFDVDLTPADMMDVSTVIAAINAAAAGATPPIPVGPGAGQFQATLTNGANGIVLEDRLGGAGAVSVRSLNGYAAEDLGFLSGTSTTGTPAQLVGEDRATVRVNSLLTTLIDLRLALDNDDSAGITIAGERLEAEVERVVSARALAGGRASRVDASLTRLEDRILLDQQVKDNLQGLDEVEAYTRFSILQTQLQASLTATAQVSRLSLLNFL